LRNAKRTASSQKTPGLISPQNKADQEKNEKLNTAAHNYFQQNFLEKGPYNLLKLKKQVNHLKEMLHNKN